MDREAIMLSENNTPAVNPETSEAEVSSKTPWQADMLVIVLLVIIANMMVGIFIFYDFGDDSAELDEEQKTVEKSGWNSIIERESRQHDLISELLHRANTFMARNQLSWPEEKNALVVFQQMAEVKGGERQAKLGVQQVADKYLRLLRQIAQQPDLVVLRTTLDSAKNLIPFVDQSYADKLLLVESELKLLEEKLAEVRVAAEAKIVPLQKFNDVLSDGEAGPEMVTLPGGVFMMSSPDQEVGRDYDEGELSEVVVSAFAVGVNEISFDEYLPFAKATGRKIPDDNGWGMGERPVINVSWRDAREYTTWLSRETGAHYRLLTEAEWEYAARSGIKDTFITGTCLDVGFANYDARSSYDECPGGGRFEGKTLPVSSLNPNAWGLHHVQGNVREWVEDCWVVGDIYPPVDGRALYGAEAGGCFEAGGKRSVRGGAWNTPMKSIRLANRFALREDVANNETGIRIAREVYILDSNFMQRLQQVF